MNAKFISILHTPGDVPFHLWYTVEVNTMARLARALTKKYVYTDLPMVNRTMKQFTAIYPDFAQHLQP